MAQVSATTLDPDNAGAWPAVHFQDLFALSRTEVEPWQRDALVRRFEQLRPAVAALDKLATRQGIDRIDTVDDVVPVLFDHRVLKSYPLSLIEKRQFARLTGWLDRLTTHDLLSIPLDDLTSLDDWIARLDEHGMIIGHTSGTSGKLSFIPRSQAEWPAYREAYRQMRWAATGIDTMTEVVPTFATTYRAGHHMSIKLGLLYSQCEAAGEAGRHVLYDYAMSSDLLALAGRLRQAEDRGELDKLDIDPALLEKRAQLIEANRHREEDLERWFTKLADEYRGQKVWIAGVSAEMTKLAARGLESGRRCDFSPDSALLTGGGMKGYAAPANWKEQIKDFFGVERISSLYGMSECMGTAPLCGEGYYHFFPFTIPIVLDENFVPLPRDGVQTGRMAVFDLLAETYWGGFITSDRVTMHWDEDCRCGWKGPRLGLEVARFTDIEGGEDDKITCAGTAEAYNEFMDYVSGV
jgi:hypothetical protein